jgi:hypothetical protein
VTLWLIVPLALVLALVLIYAVMVFFSHHRYEDYYSIRWWNRWWWGR